MTEKQQIFTFNTFSKQTFDIVPKKKKKKKTEMWRMRIDC